MTRCSWCVLPALSIKPRIAVRPTPQNPEGNRSCTAVSFDYKRLAAARRNKPAGINICQPAVDLPG